MNVVYWRPGQGPTGPSPQARPPRSRGIRGGYGFQNRCMKYEYLDGNMNCWLPWTNFKEQLNHSSTNNYKTTFPCNMAWSLRK